MFSIILLSSFFVILTTAASEERRTTATCSSVLCDSCASASSFECSSCSSSAISISNICLPYCPYGFLTDPCTEYNLRIINAQFGQNKFTGTYASELTVNDASRYQFFNNPEDLDPIPTLWQGLYFSGGKFLKTSTSFYPNVNIAFSLWIRPSNVSSTNDILYLKVTDSWLLRIDGTGGITANLEKTDGSHEITQEIEKNRIMVNNTWSFISYSVSYSPSMQQTTLTQYVDNVIDSSLLVNNMIFRFYNAAQFSLILGCGPAGNFKGFIYTFDYWNVEIRDFSNTFLRFCDGSIDCFRNCEINQYSTGTSCEPCDSSCTAGCIRAGTCSPCIDPLCKNCTGFGTQDCIECVDNAYFNKGICNCASNTFWNSATKKCEATITCDLYDESVCIHCAQGYFLFENVCILKCPTGYSQLDSLCVINPDTNGFVFNLMPHQIKNTVRDLQSNISVTTGMDDGFYPNYMFTDPLAAEYRGYYFNMWSFMKFEDPFYFAPKFTILTWINPQKTGSCTLLEKAIIYNYNPASLQLGFFNGLYPFLSLELADKSTVSYKSLNFLATQQWNLLIVSSSINSDQALIISFQINGVADRSSGLSKSWFEDSDIKEIYIGAFYSYNLEISGSFTGFLWDLKIYNKIMDFSALYSTGCSSSCSLCPLDNSGGCIVNCKLTQYWDGNSCLPCNKSCYNGCVRPDLNCNLCNDIICDICDDYDNTVCINCKANAHLSDDRCSCSDGYYWSTVNEKCEACHISCKVCRNGDFSNCIVCAEGYFMINGLCLAFCPLGYVESNNLCKLVNSQIFHLDLNTLHGIIFDRSSEIPIITGNSSNFYKNYDHDDPVPAYLRGFYFDGISSVLYLPENSLYQSPKLIMSPIITYSIWINPQSADMTIASIHDSSNTKEFELEIINLLPTLTINLQYAGIVTYACSNIVSLYEWNHLMISTLLDRLGHTYISCTINAITNSMPTDIGVSYYQASKSGTRNIIGGKLHQSKIDGFFKGFIYDIQIFNSAKEISYLAQSRCFETCLACLPTQVCIPNCGIDEFWSGSQYNNCTACNSNCHLGCKDSLPNCNLCFNSICEHCTDYASDTCTSCVQNAENATSCNCIDEYGLSNDLTSCVECSIGKYPHEGLCKNCPAQCTSCNNSTICFECVENAEMYENVCRCKTGYGNTNCATIAYFNASIKVNFDNTLNLTFSEDLLNPLLAIDVKIQISSLDESDFSYTISKINDAAWIIDLEAYVEIEKETELSVILNNSVSKTNAILIEQTLTGVLYYYDPYPNSNILSDFSIQSSAAFKAFLGLNLAVSFFTPNPSGFWSMISIMQVIYYLGLSKIPMSESFASFLEDLNAVRYFPNLFSAFIDYDEGISPYDEAVKFNYKSDIAFLNAGSDLTIFIITSVACIFIYAMIKISNSYISGALSAIFKYFKYSIFLRFWIQTYLDVGIAAILSLSYFSSENSVQISSSIFSIFFLIFVVASPTALIKFSYSNLSKITQEEENYYAKWSTLHYEFKNDKGLISTQFYFIFFIRRLIYMINIVLLGQHPETQIVINSLLSAVLIIYFAKYQPYSDLYYQIANLSSEVATLLVMISLSGNLSESVNIKLTTTETVTTALILIIIATQTVASVGVYIRFCYKTLKEGFKMIENPEHKYAISTVQPNVNVEDLERPPITLETESEQTTFSKSMFVISEEEEKS
ncbi:unnamed protein product [Blepharisma stoltei]|uniref:TNFR-Cys domain-containing protein n=1 Tax=Blepharisma stoltei TaxID=1481888 RepID=A0AAU9K7R1_9CILI|nr:unnamed protein product [Blepharisma stoltei]